MKQSKKHRVKHNHARRVCNGPVATRVPVVNWQTPLRRATRQPGAFAGHPCDALNSARRTIVNQTA